MPKLLPTTEPGRGLGLVPHPTLGPTTLSGPPPCGAGRAMSLPKLGRRVGSGTYGEQAEVRGVATPSGGGGGRCLSELAAPSRAVHEGSVSFF